MSDKLRDLIHIPTAFFPGERPTDEKLEGMMNQAEQAIEFLQETFGDLYGDRANLPSLWSTNVGRDLGDRSKISPVLMPDISLENYQQQLTLGETEHELDLIPVGVGAPIVSSSFDPSVVPSQFKNSISELQEAGDWTLSAGSQENGLSKNSRKLVTYRPSSGGSVTFNLMTSGKGSAYHGARHNVIPSVAQAVSGGPFLDVDLADASTNTYIIELPEHQYLHNRQNEVSGDTTASNTAGGVGTGQTYELPDYFFDPNYLDLGTSESIPLNSVRLYDWQNRRMVAGLQSITTSTNQVTLRTELLLSFSSDVILDTSEGEYLLVVSGIRLYEMVSQLQRDLYFHKHDGDDMIRNIDHSTLLNLRTGSETPTDRSSWYGASNIHHNDHSMYLHRDGYVANDIGGGGNIMRGDLVVGSTTTGSLPDFPNYNLSSDSNKVSFGRVDEGGYLMFDKVFNQELPEGRGNIPQIYEDTALHLQGAHSDLVSGLKTLAIDGTLRVTDDVVLGTSDSDTVFVSGELYAYKSATLTPKTPSELSQIQGETGKIVYSVTENAPVFWNGSAWVNPASSGYATTIGDGVISFGKYNGSTAAVLQQAVNDVEATGGGRILLMRGNYNVAGTPILIDTVEIQGEGLSTKLVGTGTVFDLVSNSSGGAIRGCLIEDATVGIRVDGELHDIDNVVLRNCTTGIRVMQNSTNLNISSSVRYVNCGRDRIIESSSPDNYDVFKQSMGYQNSFYILDPSNKKNELTRITRVGGSGSLTYQDSNDSAIGFGRYAISGTGTWIVNRFLPVMPAAGVAGYGSFKAPTTGSTITLGVRCFDSQRNSLGDNGGMIVNNTSVPTSWEFAMGHAINEANSGTNRLKPDTRFVQVMIRVDNNPGGVIYFDGLNVMPMNFARLALYS